MSSHLGSLMLVEGTWVMMIGVIGVGWTGDIERMAVRRMFVLFFLNFSGVRPEVLMHDGVVVEPIGHVALKLFSFEIDGRNDLLAELGRL